MFALCRAPSNTAIVHARVCMCVLARLRVALAPPCFALVCMHCFWLFPRSQSLHSSPIRHFHARASTTGNYITNIALLLFLTGDVFQCTIHPRQPGCQRAHHQDGRRRQGVSACHSVSSLQESVHEALRHTRMHKEQVLLLCEHAATLMPCRRWSCSALRVCLEAWLSQGQWHAAWPPAALKSEALRALFWP